MSRTARLGRWLGLDGNPLRRRTDKIATCLAAQLFAAFLMGALLLSVAAISWAGRAAAADQQAQRSWRQVSAVLLHAPQTTVALAGFAELSWAPAQWTAPDGRARTGEIPVSPDLTAGQVVPLWVDAAGWPTGPPLSHRGVLAREAAAAAVATVTLGIVLLCLAGVGRWVLNRRRLADWEAAWASVGPQWTRRFRSRG